MIIPVTHRDPGNLSGTLGGTRPSDDPLPRGLLLVDAAAGTSARIEELGWPTVVERVRATWALLDAEEPGEGRSARIVPVIELLNDEVDLTPGRHHQVSPDPTDVEPVRHRLLALLDSVGALLPAVAPTGRSARRPQTTVGELAKQGPVLVRQQSGRFGLASDGTGDPVLTARDVIAGREPTGRLAGAEPLDAVRLRVGDVVVPTVAPRPGARLVEQEAGALLGPNLQLLRPDRDRLDPWFLAGFLRSGEAMRAASSLGDLPDRRPAGRTPAGPACGAATAGGGLSRARRVRQRPRHRGRPGARAGADAARRHRRRAAGAQWQHPGDQ